MSACRAVASIGLIQIARLRHRLRRGSLRCPLCSEPRMACRGVVRNDAFEGDVCSPASPFGLCRGSLLSQLRFERRLVGARGFEPPTPCSQSRCATRLRHAPMQREFEIRISKSETSKEIGFELNK
jgi:hypothetical protein